MKLLKCCVAAMAVCASAISYAKDPTAPTTINRSMNVVQVTNTSDGPVNDFHIEFIARDLDGNYLDLEDLDPLGYYNTAGGVPLTTIDPVTHRITIAWTFALLPPGDSATFGYTLFGGFRFEGVDCYWTLNGARVQNFPDVWQDWVTTIGLRQIQDVILYRPTLPPPTPPPPEPATLFRTVNGELYPNVVAIDQVAILPAPPDPLPIPPPDTVVPLTEIAYPWSWPYGNATYFMFYTVQNMMDQPIMNFKNAALMARNPFRNSTVPYELSSDAFPPTDTGYGSTTEVSFPGDVMIRNLKVSSFSDSTPLPSAAGGAVIQSFTSQVSLELSTDAGANWQSVVAAPPGLARAALETSDSGTRTFDTEMLQLDLSAGLPEGLRIRESPSLPSRGRTSATETGQGYQIDSFFDIFLEVSLDDGQTWTPGSTAVELDLSSPPTVTLNRSMNVMRVWTGPGVWANDFHVEFEARNGADTRYLDLDDLDPAGFYQGVFVTNRVVTYNALSNRVSITWYFPDVCVTTNAPAFFGFTLFGGVRYQAVDWYWTYNGQRIIAFQDVWQDWVKNLLTRRLEDVIIPRPLPIPPPPVLPTPVVSLQRVTGSTPAPISIATLATTAVPPNPIVPEPGPVLVTNLVPVVYDWAWPGVDPTYFMYYDLLDEAGERIAGFQNAAILTPEPEAGTPAPVETPTDAFPTPDGVYASALGQVTTFGSAGWIRNFTVSMVGPGGTLPPEGDAALRTVSAVMDFEGGNGVEPPEQMMFTVRPTLRVETEGTEGGGGSRILATEVVSLDTDPDPANPGLRFRESPSRPSLGRSVVQPLPDGRYSIDSFFDIFLEVSLDDGQTWTPADTPVRVVLTLPPPPQIPVTLNRSLNSVRVWTPPGMMANDFHIDFIAQKDNGLYLSLADLDPFGYVGTIATNRVVSFDPLGNRVSITWFFPDMCVLSNAPAFFGFTVFGGVTYVAVDWYWTYNGERIWSYEDVWQDWIKFNGSLRDVIVRRQPVIPPPLPPTPVRSVRRVVGLQPQPLPIQQLPSLVLPPSPVWPDPGPIVVGPTVTNIVAEWAWPGLDPTYFVYYDLLDSAGQPIAGFRNAASLVEQPDFETETPQFTGTTLFPPPTLNYVEKPEGDFVQYGPVWTRDFTIRPLSPDLPLPAPGEATLGTFPARVQFDLSSDGGGSWQTLVAEIQLTARIVSTGLTDPFDMELLAVEAPAMPGGLRIRESPTLPSLGRTTVSAGEGGGYMISSFFDIFTELSIDGGGSWIPGSRKARVILQNLANETAPSEKRFLPKDTACQGYLSDFARFPNDVQLNDFTLGFVSHSGALPLAGQTNRVVFMARANFNLTTNGGTDWVYTWSTVRAEADLVLLGSQDACDVYSADFKRFDLFGGTLPPGLQVRVRSQSRAESSGFYEVREVSEGDYRIQSFFDIFLEVSTDSGGSWTGAERPSGLLLSDAKPAPVVLEAWADPRSRQALVMFNRLMGPSAVDPNNYTLAGENPASLLMLRDGRTVLAGFTNTPPSPAVLTVQDVYDADGHSVAPTTATVSEGLIQRHAVAAASLKVGLPDNPPLDVSLLGSSLLLIEVPYSGLSRDSDGDGRDDAIARILDFDLENTGGSHALRSSDLTMALGSVEEQDNPVSNHLDLPPFGAGQGLFHIGQFNFIVEIEGLSYTPAFGLELQGEFLDAYMSGGASLGWRAEPDYVPLLDDEGSESGYSLGRLTLIPDQPPVSIEVDGDGSWHVRWPKPSTNMQLQFATSLELQDWSTVDPSSYVDEGMQWSYEILPEGGACFYRLLLVEEEPMAM